VADEAQSQAVPLTAWQLAAGRTLGDAANGFALGCSSVKRFVIDCRDPS